MAKNESSGQLKALAIVLVCVAAALLAVSYGSRSNTSTRMPVARQAPAGGSSSAVTKPPAPPEPPQWRHQRSSDEMTGRVRAFAMSPETTATRRMDFPYSDVTATMAFGCDSDSEWTYIHFSKAPNLTNTEPESGGYSTFTARIRWDDEVQNTRMIQEWGEPSLHFSDDGAAVAKIAASAEALVELDWYGAGNVYFPFSMAGSSDAIATARQVCGEKQAPGS